MNGRFLINRRDAKIMGVAAGLADYSGIDVLLIRLGTMLAGDTELGVDVGEVAGDRPLSKEEGGRYLTIRAALRNEDSDPSLGGRQPLLTPAAAENGYGVTFTVKPG